MLLDSLDPARLRDVTGGLGLAGKVVVGGTIVATVGLSLASYVHNINRYVMPRARASAAASNK